MAELPGWIKSVCWWARWWVRYFPGQAWRRLTSCRREHRGPIYDGIEFCLHCGAPWFSSKTLVEITHGVKIRNVAAEMLDASIRAAASSSAHPIEETSSE